MKGLDLISEIEDIEIYFKSKINVLKTDGDALDPRSADYRKSVIYNRYSEAVRDIKKLLSDSNAYWMFDDISNYKIVEKETEDEDGRDKKG